VAEVTEVILPLAGLQFYRLRDCADYIVQGSRLRLRREPDNKYDAHAILVELQASDLIAQEMPLPDGMTPGACWKLGHIPARTTTENWARLLSTGLDAGLGADCYFEEGERSGAWTLWVRVAGPAVDAALTEVVDRDDATDGHSRLRADLR
jgi:hypothetical protein